MCSVRVGGFWGILRVLEPRPVLGLQHLSVVPRVSEAYAEWRNKTEFCSVQGLESYLPRFKPLMREDRPIPNVVFHKHLLHLENSDKCYEYGKTIRNMKKKTPRMPHVLIVPLCKCIVLMLFQFLSLPIIFTLNFFSLLFLTLGQITE